MKPLKPPSQTEAVGVKKLRKMQIFYMVVVGLFAVGLIMLGSRYSLTAQVASSNSAKLSDCTSNLQTCQSKLDTAGNQLLACSKDYTALQTTLTTCNTQLLSVNASYTTCKNQLTGTQGQLSSCNSEKGTCQTSLTTCNTDKTNCQNSLSTCNSDKSSLQSNLDTLAQNFGASKCCGAVNYTYYYVESSNVICTSNSTASTKTTGC